MYKCKIIVLSFLAFVSLLPANYARAFIVDSNTSTPFPNPPASYAFSGGAGPVSCSSTFPPGVGHAPVGMDTCPHYYSPGYSHIPVGPSSGNLRSVILQVAVDNHAHYSAAVGFSADPGDLGTLDVMSNGSLTATCTSDNALHLSDMTARDTWQSVEFLFSSCTIDFSTDYISNMTFVNNGTGAYYGWTMGFDSTDQPYYIINNSATAPTVRFESNAFRQGMVSPDFSQWFVCVNIPLGAGITDYYYTVEYPDSGFATIDSLKDNFGAIPTYGLAITNECSLLSKGTALTPGSVLARTKLYDGNDNLLAIGDILSFTVSSGTGLDGPPAIISGNVPGQSTLTCSATSFAINNDTLGIHIDFGKGFCLIVSYLFAPKESDFSQFSTLWDGIKNKPPLGYFTVTKDAIADLEVGTSSSYLVLPTEGLIVDYLFDPLKILISTLCYFLAGIFIYKRLSKFNWHT